MGNAFCEACRRDVGFSLEPAIMKGTLKGEAYIYSGEKAVCSACKNEVHVFEVEDKNLKALYDAYREMNDILSLEKILEIPKKYHIEKRHLSLLLGWGEMTFSRYSDGGMPTKQYSKMLRKVYDEPQYYKTLLDTNKENLKSTLAYEKSMRKVQELLGQNPKTRT